MPDHLLTPEQVAERLGISRSQFYRLKPVLIARGLQQVVVVHRKKYREASLDRLIEKVAVQGGVLA